MYRSESYNERFSKEIRKPVYAQTYILALIQDEDEPMTVEEALKLVIQKMGTTDFANFVGERPQTIDKFLKGERTPKRATLDKFLKPFNLKTTLILEKIKTKKAAS